MQVWAAAWRSLEPPALPPHGAAPHAAGAGSMQGRRGRRGGTGDRREGGRDRALAKGPPAGGPPAQGRGPLLALQGVAARPRAQLLALALVALEQGVAALPPSTLRQGPWVIVMSTVMSTSGLALALVALDQGVAQHAQAGPPPGSLSCLLSCLLAGWRSRWSPWSRARPRCRPARSGRPPPRVIVMSTVMSTSGWALALVALEQGVAALPPSTLRCPPRWLSDLHMA